MRKIQSLLGLMLAANIGLCELVYAAPATTLNGKLWIVAWNYEAAIPPPSATPDATFTIHQAAFSGQGPNSINKAIKQNFTISTFLSSISPASQLVFSGQPNPVTGTVITAKTQLTDAIANLTDGTYKTAIELTGTIRIANGQYLAVAHNGGVALYVDGVTLPGFNSSDSPTMDYTQFSGGGGKHTLDLVYVAFWGAEILMFGPAP